MFGKTFLASLSLVLAAASSVNGLVAPLAPRNVLSGSEAHLPTRSTPLDTDTDAKRHETNGERMARGAGLAEPKRLYTPTHGARSGAASQVAPINRRAMLAVVDASTSAFYGYLSKNSANGVAVTYDSNVANALVLDFSTASGATSASKVQFTMENSNFSKNILGLAVLNSPRTTAGPNIRPGSSAFGVFTGSNTTPAGSTPQQVGNSYSDVTGTQYPSETSVWNVDLVALTAAPQWINSDGGALNTIPIISNGALLFTGDKGAYSSAESLSSVPPTVKFTMVLL